MNDDFGNGLWLLVAVNSREPRHGVSGRDGVDRGPHKAPIRPSPRPNAAQTESEVERRIRQNGKRGEPKCERPLVKARGERVVAESTRAMTRSGRDAASATATYPPNECPTRTTEETPSASISTATITAASGMAKASAARLPWAGRSIEITGWDDDRAFSTGLHAARLRRAPRSRTTVGIAPPDRSAITRAGPATEVSAATTV